MDARLLEIVQLAHRGEHQRALLDLRTYLNAQPDDVYAWLALGNLTSDVRIQLSALRRAVQLDPTNEVAQRALREKLTPAPSAPRPETALLVEAEVTTDTSNPSEAEEASVSPLVSAAASQPLALESAPAVDMTLPAEVREARACTWPFQPRNGAQRALGALLDAGRVTRQDLLWAAAEARDKDVRHVAQTILDGQHRLLNITMSIEDARLVSWPFRNLNRPLGRLVDADTVRVKDLRRAAWFAKDARVREAARLLLPLAKEHRAAKKRAKSKAKPKPAAPTTAAKQPATVTATSAARHAMRPRAKTRPMPIIQGSNYLVQEIQRRYQRQLRMTVVSVLLLLSGAGLMVYLVITSLLRNTQPAVWVWPLLLVCVLPLFWLSERLVELWDEEHNFRKGQQGEIMAARQLRQGLGGDWVLFRNVQLPGSRVDIDMVLLGPPGLYAVEVKTYSGRYRYQKKNFYRSTPMLGWRKMHHNPGRQARSASTALHQYITQTLNENIWVEPRLAWVGSGTLYLQEPDVYVWYRNNLNAETARLRTLSPRLSVEQRAALSGLLRGLCSTLR